MIVGANKHNGSNRLAVFDKTNLRPNFCTLVNFNSELQNKNHALPTDRALQLTKPLVGMTTRLSRLLTIGATNNPPAL